MTALQRKLNNTKGRFVTLTVNRARSGPQSYCAKVQSITDKSVTFWSVNDKRSIRVPLSNVSVA